MLDYREYRDDEVMTILAAYRDIFGQQLSDTLVDYWDLHPSRRRPWSHLTTDFRHVTLDQLKRVQSEAAADDVRFRTGYHSALADGGLHAYCIAHGRVMAERAEKRSRQAGIALGHSIGICPWSDHGLLTTWNSSKKQAIIIAGHDWYPIVPANNDGPHPLDAPLFQRGLHTLVGRSGRQFERYVNGAPSAVYEENAVMVFLNLVPDFRPPATPVQGKWLKDHRPYLPGFTAAVEAVARRYGPDNVTLISWGADLWEAVRPLIPEYRRTGVMAMAKRAQGEPFKFAAGQYVVPYLPLAHPSFDSNFKNSQRWRHFQHVVAGYGRLGLGHPGLPFSTR